MMIIYFYIFLYFKLENNFDSYANPYEFQDRLMDLNISCSNDKIQEVNLTDDTNINSISISKNANVTITCNQSSQFSQNKLLNNDNPNITIKYHCYFDVIEIYGSPAFRFLPYSNITARKVFLNDSSKKIEIDSSELIYLNNKTNKFLNLNPETISISYTYNELNIELNDSAMIRDIRYKIIPYENFSQYEFYVEDSINIYNYHNNSIHYAFDIVLPRMRYEPNVKIRFNNFKDLDSLLPKIDTIKDTSLVLINMNWMERIEKSNCIWKTGDIHPKFEFMKKKVDHLVKNEGWRRICFEADSYLYPTDSRIKADVKVISTAASWIIIVSIVLAIILLFILVFFIAYFKYLKYTSKTQVENEHFSNQSLSKNDDESSSTHNDNNDDNNDDEYDNDNFDDLD